MAVSIRTPECRLSYPNLFVPRPNDEGKMKYGAAFIFDKKTDISELKRALLTVAKETWGDKAVEMIKNGALHWPINDGGKRMNGDSYADGYGPDVVFFNANGDNQPGCVDRYNDPKTGKPRIITDAAELYAGCYVRMLIRAYPFGMKPGSKKKGVTFGLEHVQKLREGERLDGRTALANAFDGEDQQPGDFGGGSGASQTTQDELNDLLG